MWHELVLSGIGGRTIAEAKANITPAEYADWVTYINQFGPLNTNRRLEFGFALLAHLIEQSHGGSRTMTDFMPYAKSEQSSLTFEEAMEQWA